MAQGQFYSLPSQSITATNPSVGVNGDTAPTSSTEIGGINPSGKLQPISVDANGNLFSPVNTNGNIYNNAAVGTSPVTVTVPANAVGFILEAESSNSANIRWCVGSVASSSVGMLAEPGRDSGYVPIADDISVIALSGTQAISVQWILSK